MTDRATLAIHKLDEFKLWLATVGAEYRSTSADWQVLQVRLPGDSRWHAIYRKLHAKEHLSVPGPLERLVREFVGRPQRLISMNRCCEKAVPLGVAVCPACAEISEGYQDSMSANDAPPWE